MPSPKIRKVGPLPSEEAKWTELRKIEWTDQTGKERVWEAAARKTRKSSGIDAVAIAPILRHPNKPPSTMIILQYRPPIEATCVEFPAGLIDEGETPEQAAVRELKEETGYEGKVLDCSPTIVADPGLTNANMQMVTVEVNLKEGEEPPEQHLDEGEYIERVVVPLSQLYDKLQGKHPLQLTVPSRTASDSLAALSKEEGKIVDARLFHWALGLHWSQRLGIKG
ncbi:hypothetical protein LTR37_004017 [Vermiconidia calcicola]|uniref:Uncharacterized protein n=1 Tax=Vermiconidia calcicola TaxID=1690605 RepID=A0ACC3NP75_9PEZI|nr:hypothetical protein LTR37_004017 [Vermiconidia calcicola]